MRLYAAILLSLLVALAGVLLGYWWLPFPVAVVLGAVAARAIIALPAGAATGLVAWLVPLAVGQARYGVGATANSLAAVMGFAHLPVIPIVLTLVVGTLLGMTGAWLGMAARGLTSAATGDSFRHQ